MTTPGYTFPHGACEVRGEMFSHPFSAALNVPSLLYLGSLLILRWQSLTLVHASCVFFQAMFEIVHTSCHMDNSAFGDQCLLAIHTAGVGMCATFGLSVASPKWQFVTLVAVDFALVLVGAHVLVKALNVFAHVTLIAATAARKGMPFRPTAIFTALTAVYYAFESTQCGFLRTLIPTFPWHMFVELGGLFVFVSTNEALIQWKKTGLGKKSK